MTIALIWSIANQTKIRSTRYKFFYFDRCIVRAAVINNNYFKILNFFFRYSSTFLIMNEMFSSSL